MNILVTGAEGQLGSELCRQLGPEASGVDLPGFDLTDRPGVLAHLLDVRPQGVINTAAYTLVDRAEDEPEVCRAVNVRGVAHLAEACRRVGCPLVQISTDYVFGGEAGRSTPYREGDSPSPQGVYARSKLDGEREAARWEKHVVIRTCGLYGQPGSRSPGNFVETMLRLGAERDRLRVVSDQHCTPSYVVHVARAVRFLFQAGAWGTYHVTNTGQTTWHELAREIFRLAGLSVKVEAISTAEYGAKAPRPGYSVLDTGKYHALPGRPEMPRWQDALAEYLAARDSRGALPRG